MNYVGSKVQFRFMSIMEVMWVYLKVFIVGNAMVLDP